MSKLGTILDQIDSGTVLLPEFQRGYVWNRDQVRGLMRSLYKGYPVGSLLTWETETDPGATRGSGEAKAGVKLLPLDGQQRVTSLYGVMRGRPPAFFEGNEQAFTGLRFNLETETFEFYAPTKMKDDPTWIDVTELFQHGLAPQLARLSAMATDARYPVYMERLARLTQLADRVMHEETISGADKTADVVVDIFNKVNSGGTKLSKGDLALAKICASWPEAREKMRASLDHWKDAGFDFSLDWLLRNATAVATGRPQFESLDAVRTADFAAALEKSTRYIGDFLDLVGARLGLDHNRVLMGRYAIPVVTRYLHLNGGKFASSADQDRMLFWYVHGGLWGRFAGSTETVLAQDYETVQAAGIDGLIASLERWRGGNLTIGTYDFEASTLGSRFYPLLYLMTRVREARDLGSGVALKNAMLGHLSRLEVHHIFPKAVLYDYGYERSEVNAVANFCFLTQHSNLDIRARRPADYLAQVERSHPGVLASQWIPTNRSLWELDRYPSFLAARRELLTAAANEFLAELRDGTSAGSAPRVERVFVDEVDEQDPRVVRIRALVGRLTDDGYAVPRLNTEIADPDTGAVLAVAEAFWPDGLQPGQGEPIVLELDPAEAGLDRLEELGYRVFDTIPALEGFIRRQAEESGAEADGVEPAESEVAPPAASDDEPAGRSQAEVKRDFERAMRSVYERAKDEAGYHATYFIRMLSEIGGLATAKQLLGATNISEGFTALWERGRLDLTVEALVIDDTYASLFTDEERETARERLDQFGFAGATSPGGRS